MNLFSSTNACLPVFLIHTRMTSRFDGNCRTDKTLDFAVNHRSTKAHSFHKDSIATSSIVSTRANFNPSHQLYACA